MLKKIVLILILVLITSLLAYEIDNIERSNGSDIYFSVGRLLNYEYFEGDFSSTINFFKSYYFQKNREQGLTEPNLIDIVIPKPIVEEKLKIKNSFYVMELNRPTKPKNKPLQIGNFFLRYWDGAGDLNVFMDIPDTSTYRRRSLFLISDEKITFTKIFTPMYILSTNEKQNEEIINLVIDYFYNNRDVLKLQLTSFYPLSDSLKGNALKKDILSRFDMEVLRLSDNCYYIIGSSTEDENIPFFAVVFPNTGKVIMKIHLRFYQYFKIDNNYYFYCQQGKPYTGANSYYIYKLNGDELIKVFIDGSFSM